MTRAARLCSGRIVARSGGRKKQAQLQAIAVRHRRVVPDLPPQYLGLHSSLTRVCLQAVVGRPGCLRGV